MQVLVKKLNENAVVPKFAHRGDAGADLVSVEEVVIPAGERRLVGTGIAIQLPPFMEAQIRPRSGLAAKNGITVLNTPGTIDCFSDSMRISTMDGEKTIKEITINDSVISMDCESVELEKDSIDVIFDKGEMDTLVVETEDGVIEITPYTEVFTKNGIKLGIDLTEDDEIVFMG